VIIPQEALAYIKNKNLKVGFSYKDVWNEEHAASFTVAKAMQLDVLSDMHNAVIQAVEKGQSFDTFKKSIKPTLQQKGWWGRKDMTDPLTGRTVDAQLGSDRRLKTIYNVNMRSAYQKGQYDRTMESDLHPYLMYRIGPSVKHRQDHESWDGLILPKNDPFWDSHFPPNGWGCKCYTRAVTENQRKKYEAEGIPVPPAADGSGGGTLRIKSEAPPVTYKAYVNERKGIVEKVPVGVDPAFNWHIGKNGRQQALQALREKIENSKKILMGNTALFEDAPLPLEQKEIKELERLSDMAYRNLTENEKFYVGNYTRFKADYINNYLANKGAGWSKGAFKKDINNIDAAIEKFTLDRSILVYKGTDAEFYKNLKVGDIFKNPIYFSTSLNRGIAEKISKRNNHPLMVEIRVPKGSKGLYIGDNTEYTDNQMEYLIKRSSKYLVVYKDSQNMILEVIVK